MNREQCLKAALDAVNSRPNAYGPPEQNFDRIAALWNIHILNTGFALVGMEGDIGRFVPADVAIFLALVKIARLAESPDHTDSWVDLAGYAACGAEVSTGDDRKRAAFEDDDGAWPEEEEGSAAGQTDGVAASDDYYQYGDCQCEHCRALHSS